MTDAQTALDIPVGVKDMRLTIGMRDTVKGFAQNFRNTPAGYVQVQVPQGSANSAAATQLAGDIRRTLQNSGIRSQQIIMMKYRAGGRRMQPHPPVFHSNKAVTAPCGAWPEDLSDNTAANRNWYNFGCASQNNLAAQIDNPMDLVAPRARPDRCAQRSNVISTYRGDSTSSGTTITINSN